MAYYLIGDIQGCYDPLQRLLKKIRFDPAADHLLLCGDVVSRGGYSLEVLRLLHSLSDRVTITLGNHDFNLLAENARHPEGGSRDHEFERIFKAPDREKLIEWLAGQRMAFWSEPHRLLLVHAGVVPQWSAADTIANARDVEAVLASEKRADFLAKLFRSRKRQWQDDLGGLKRLALATNILTRIRYCDAAGKLNLTAKGPPGSQPPGYKPWFKHKHRRTRDVTVAFGHWASLGLHVRKRLLGVDTGCVWGGVLTAVRLEDRWLFQVEGKNR